MTRGPLLIVGASGRAAAASAIRAGFQPYVIDLFADEDTKRLASTLKCELKDYPQGLAELAKTLPPMPWMYTGGLENHPDVIDAIHKHRPLLGNRSTSLSYVRDPFIWNSILDAHHLPHARILPGEQSGFEWVRKSFKSSGGLAHDNEHDPFITMRPPCDYQQEYLEGESYSGFYAASTFRNDFLGVTRQLVGEAAFHAKPFRYCGSIGPVVLDESLMKTIRAAGNYATHYGLRRGVFGIDFIVCQDQAYAIDVNPRYVASAEIYDYARQQAHLIFHDQLCNIQKYEAGDDEETGWVNLPNPLDCGKLHGKAIYFAPRDIRFPDSGPWDQSLAECQNVWMCPAFADIPAAGSLIRAGEPVLTLFASAANADTCLDTLKLKATELDRLFGVAT